MPLPKTGNHGRPRTARQEKPAKAKIVTGGNGKKMVGKKMTRQGVDRCLMFLPFFFHLVAAERSEAALGHPWLSGWFSIRIRSIRLVSCLDRKNSPFHERLSRCAGC